MAFENQATPTSTTDGEVVARSDELGEGDMMVIDPGNAPGGGVMLVRVDGRVHGIDAICTHAMGYLDEGELDGYDVICPLHRARFDVRTGEVTKRPADRPLGCYKVWETDGEIYFGGGRG